MSRVWPMPDMRVGTTIHIASDLHAGQRYFTKSWLNRAAQDIGRLKNAAHGHIVAGDLIDWQNNPLDEDKQYIAWRDQVRSDGLPYLGVPGNHDLENHSVANSNDFRTSLQWEASVREAANGFVDIRGIRVIAAVPSVWRFVDDGDPHQQFILAPEQLVQMGQWIAGANGRKVIVMTHLPIYEHYGAGASAVQPQADMPGFVAAHPEIIGWVSGHKHANPTMINTYLKVVAIGGRNIFSINAPAIAGRMDGVSVERHGLDSASTSLYVTFDGDHCDIRWRDHHRGAWARYGASGSSFMRLTL